MAALQQDTLKSLLHSTPALPFLSPAPAVFGKEALVEDATSGERYSAARMGDWLQDSGAQQASRPRFKWNYNAARQGYACFGTWRAV